MNTQKESRIKKVMNLAQISAKGQNNLQVGNIFRKISFTEKYSI